MKIVKEKKLGIKWCEIFIFFFPILFILFFLWVRVNHFQTYEIVAFEDGVLEWGQFYLYFLSAILAILLAIRFRKNRILLVIYSLMAMAFLFISLEEISWGERIFGTGVVPIPEDLMSRNVQGEINFHNIDSIHSSIGYVYIAIGFVGCFAWLGMSILRRFMKLGKDLEERLLHIIPPWYYFFYFFPLFINLITMYEFMPQDYEVVETVLSIGLFVFVLGNFVRFRRVNYFDYVKKELKRSGSKS